MIETPDRRSTVRVPEICRLSADARGDGLRHVAVRIESTLAGEGIERVSPPQSGRSLLVTSIDASTSTIACQLAGVFAETGRRTCLVDATDKAESGAAPSSSVSGSEEPGAWIDAEAIRVAPLRTDVSNLDVLPLRFDAATRVGLLTIDRVRRLTSILNEDRDWIVWAGPGISSSSGMAVAGAVDGVVLVVVPGRTTRNAARRAIDAIAAVRGRLLGTILCDD